MAASDYVPIFFKNRLHLAGASTDEYTPECVVVGTGWYRRTLWSVYRRTPSWSVPSCTNRGLGT